MEMSGGGGGDFSDRNQLLRSNPSVSSSKEGDSESQGGSHNNNSNRSSRGIRDLLKLHLDRGLSLSGRRLSPSRLDSENPSHHHLHPPPPPPVHIDHDHHLDVADAVSTGDALGDSAPPEWALLLVGCLLGLATGLCVAAFNHGVCHYIPYTAQVPRFIYLFNLIQIFLISHEIC